MVHIIMVSKISVRVHVLAHHDSSSLWRSLSTSWLIEKGQGQDIPPDLSLVTHFFKLCPAS